MEKGPGFNKTQEVEEKKENKIEVRNTRNVLLGMGALILMTAAIEAEAKSPGKIAKDTSIKIEDIGELNFNKEKELGYKNPDKDFSYGWGSSNETLNTNSDFMIYKRNGHLFLYGLNKPGSSNEVGDVFILDEDCDGNADLIATRSELPEGKEKDDFFDNEYMNSGIYDNYNLDSIKVNLEKEGFKVVENKNKLVKDVSNAFYNNVVTDFLTGLKDPEGNVNSVLTNIRNEEKFNKLDASVEKQKLKDQKNEQNKKDLENARARQNKW